jgi:hypothetical protein
MKPYRTSFLSVAALMMLLSSLSFFKTQSANAECKFTISTADTAWSFSAVAGTKQTRVLTITNISDSDIIVTADIVNGTEFGLSQDQFSLAPGDTASLAITLEPAAGLPPTSATAILRLATSNSDCRRYLTLYGTITAANNGGGDKVVTLDPSSFVFSGVAAGSDTCQAFYLVNHTGVKVTVTSLILIGSDAFTMTPAFNGATIDSGGYYRFTVCFKGSATNSHLVDSIIAVCSYGGVTHVVEGQILGYTSDPPPPVVLVADPHEFTFGTVKFGTSACKNVVVTNKSNSPVILRYWGTCDSTTSYKDFSVTPASGVPDTLSAGGSITFTICYKPHEANIQGSCNLSISYYQLSTPPTDGILSVYFNGNSQADTINNTPVCLRTEQGSNYQDPVVVGGSADHTLYLINSSSHSITLNTVDIYGTDAGVFTIPTSQLPITVPANSSNTTIYYVFSPTSNSKFEYSAHASFSLSGDSLVCDSAGAALVGYVVRSINTVDSVVRPLFPTDSRTLGLEGNGATVSTTFYFTNNLQVDCTVNKIWLASGQFFKISSTNPSPTPFVLHPGDNLTVIITYTATDHYVHHDSLMIDANHNLQAQSFELQGVQLAASVSATLPADVAINVSPNPASSYVTVNMAGVRSADIQVIDLLGNIITTAKAASSYRWDASSSLSGSYIVRISGISTGGEQFVASKRIIVAK